jgi:hemerythrin-like domain-containing protein
MIEAIEVLRQEHRNIESLLRVLERELAVFERGDRPDYGVVLAVVDYFKDYPHSCHHPKEDLIFEKLKTRDPVATAAIGDLEAEHREGARRLYRLADVIAGVWDSRDFLWQSVDDMIRDFIDHERRHMATEEHVVFPAALTALHPEDWADIALKLADRYDPLSSPGSEEKFIILRQLILRLEENAEMARPD